MKSSLWNFLFFWFVVQFRMWKIWKMKVEICRKIRLVSCLAKGVIKLIGIQWLTRRYFKDIDAAFSTFVMILRVVIEIWRKRLSVKIINNNWWGWKFYPFLRPSVTQIASFSFASSERKFCKPLSLITTDKSIQILIKTFIKISHKTIHPFTNLINLQISSNLP